MDGPSKGLRVKNKEAKKQCLPENFPSSSTCEMDNSTVWSQRSMASGQAHDSHSNIGSSTDFVNSGKCKAPLMFSSDLFMGKTSFLLVPLDFLSIFSVWNLVCDWVIELILLGLVFDGQSSNLGSFCGDSNITFSFRLFFRVSFLLVL